MPSDNFIDPTVCFVVTGQATGQHVKMLHLSVLSLRRIDATANVILVTDLECLESMRHNCASMIDLFSKVHVEKSPYDNPVTRCREMRIKLRRMVTGPILYVDGDTIFLRKVHHIPIKEKLIHACYDFNYSPKRTVAPTELGYLVDHAINELGMKSPISRFNAGVFLMMESSQTLSFVADWLEIWNRIQGYRDKRIQHLADQIAFNLACDKHPEIVGLLPDKYNAMVRTSPHLCKKASILHFFGSPAQIEGTLLEYLLFRLQETGKLDEQAIDRCLRERHPWGPNPEAWMLWKSRNYLGAIMAKISKLARRKTQKPQS